MTQFQRTTNAHDDAVPTALVMAVSRNELDSGPTKPGLWLAVVTQATLPEQEAVKWYSAEAARAVAVPTDCAVVLTDVEALDEPLSV